MDAKLEYNISAKIAELVKNFPKKINYIIVILASDEKHNLQDTFFISKNGKMMNGKREVKK